MIMKIPGALFLSLTFAAVAACGGGGAGTLASGGIGGSGFTTGPVSGFGSVFVNGVEFDTAQANIQVNGQPSAESALRLGMLVKVKGTVDAARKTGRAENISFDADLDGVIEGEPVQDSTNPALKSFSVLGTQVIAEDKQTVFDNVTFALLAKGQSVEVSGFFDQVAAALRATRLEKKDSAGATASIQGKIEELVQSAGTGTFRVRGATVSFDSITKLPDGGLSEGLRVKVTGQVTDAINRPDLMVAEEIELAAADIPDDTDTSVQGIVNSFVSLRNFKLDGFAVDAGNADFSPASLASTLGNGIWVEVEGTFSNGVLLAEEVSSRQPGVKVSATISSVDPDAAQIILNATPAETLTISVNSSTLISDGEGRPLRLEQMLPDTFLEVRAQQSAGQLIASRIESDSGNRITIEGAVEGVDLAGETQGTTGTGIGTVKLLGVTFVTDASTAFKPADFFERIKEGDKIKVRDRIVANGVGDRIADEVEIKD